MRRVLLVLVAAGLVLAGAWYLAGLPGSITIRLDGLTIAAPTALAVLVLIVGFLLGHLLLRLLAGLIHLPSRLRAWRAARNRRLGDAAATGAMVALAAGEAAEARGHAARARRLLGETAHTLLLTAQAARLANRHDESEAALRALTARPDTAFLGYRGLMRRATERGDWDEAAKLAHHAEAAHPGATWLRGERRGRANSPGAPGAMTRRCRRRHLPTLPACAPRAASVARRW